MKPVRLTQRGRHVRDTGTFLLFLALALTFICTVAWLLSGLMGVQGVSGG